MSHDRTVAVFFRPEDIQVGDVFDYARREQWRFFRGRRYSPDEVASMIALEAMLCGAEDVRVKVADGWICVYADVDWLEGIEASAFSGFAPFTPGGPNSVTAEFFLVVFSAAVATATREGARPVKGDSPGPLDKLGGDWKRAVAFALATVR
jgi:hypothetical protein